MLHLPYFWQNNELMTGTVHLGPLSCWESRWPQKARVSAFSGCPSPSRADTAQLADSPRPWVSWWLQMSDHASPFGNCASFQLWDPNDQMMFPTTHPAWLADLKLSSDANLSIWKELWSWERQFRICIISGPNNRSWLTRSPQSLTWYVSKPLTFLTPTYTLCMTYEDSQQGISLPHSAWGYLR